MLAFLVWLHQAYVYGVEKKQLEELGLILEEVDSDGDSDEDFNEAQEGRQRGVAAAPAAAAAVDGGGQAEETEWNGGLHVDNKERGNISRFINCCWARESARKQINVQAVVAWNGDIKRPVLSLVPVR